MSKNVNIKVTADAGDINKVVDQVSSQLSRLENKLNSTSTNTGKGFTSMATKASAMGNIIANVVSKIASVVSSSMGEAVTRLDALNNFPKVMSNLGIGADDAQKAMDKLNDKLLGLPTSLSDAVLAVQRFTSANQNVGYSTDLFLALNNAILAGGAGAQIQASAMEQLSQSYAKGKPDMIEWRTAMTAMPAQLAQVAKAMGYVNATALGNALTQGDESMQNFMDTIVKMNTQGVAGFQSFDAQARNATGGVGTAITNLKTAIVRGLADVMNAIGQANIANFFNGITRAIGQVIPYVVVVVKIIASAVGIISNLLGGLFGGSKKTSNDTAKNTQKTADALKGATAGSGAVASNLGNAAKNAKAVTTQLAGFDEMNTLKTPTDSGADAGAGAGGVGVPDGYSADLGDVTGKLDKIGALWKKVTDFATKAWDIMKKVAKTLWDLLPEPVQKALEAFGKALLAIFQNPVFQQFLIIFGVILGVIAVAVGLFMLLSPIFEAIGAVFGIVFSPVVLVIAAIIAIVILLIMYWDEVKNACLVAWNAILSFLSTVGNWIYTNVIKPVADFFTGLWDGIVKGVEAIAQPFVTVFDIWWAVVSKLIEILLKIVEIFTVLLAVAIQWLWNSVIYPIWSGMVSFFSGIWQGIVNIFTPVAQWFGKVFTDAWNGIKNIFGAVGGFFKGVWDTIVSIFGAVGSAIGNAIAGAVKGVVNSILDFAENTINGFIKAINTAIGVINKIPGVNISKLSLLSIPRLAKGGVVNGSTLANIGEAGAEAVVPLENNTGWLDKIADRLRQGAGDGQPLQVVVKLGEETIMSKIIDGINDRSKMSGQNAIIV